MGFFLNSPIRVANNIIIDAFILAAYFPFDISLERFFSGGERSENGRTTIRYGLSDKPDPRRSSFDPLALCMLASDPGRERTIIRIGLGFASFLSAR